MGSLSNYVENKLLDHVLKVASFTPPTIYIGLSTADPTDDGSGLAEPSGKGYLRVEVEEWSAAASRASQNEVMIEFPEARGSWGVITHFALFDSLSGGNMLGHGSLAESKTVNSGDSIYFEAGMVDVFVPSGGWSDAYANAILDHLLGNAVLSQPGNIWVALAIAAILDADTGSTITEPSGGSYARVAHNVWDAASGGASENTGEINFPTATADWGTLTHVALADLASGGNVILHGALGSSVVVDNGDNAHWNDGALDITVD